MLSCNSHLQTDHSDASVTSLASEQLHLFEIHPGPHENTLGPMPEPDQADQLIAAGMNIFVDLLGDCALEKDLGECLWNVVNIFHRRIAWLDRLLDDNEQQQRRLTAEQDGSEIKSVELERSLAMGELIIERRDMFETFREIACDHYETLTASAWRPRNGSLTNRRTVTAAMIDSRDFLVAKRKAEIEPLLPSGPRIAFTGGLECNDHVRIWEALDAAKSKHPDMVLIHGGSPKGAEKIAACWADNRGVSQIVFKPDWNRFRNAAPFKRNDQMLDALPIGVIVFPGSGISQNLADKARKAGIPVWRFGKDGT
ncbi:DUF2493 domain-containing protein [Thalassospira xiamenensis]|uniref:YspA cpYpsA-related SLOG domain-containing protein n=1 Tax=Thalassospira xiamenensis TaxID=220697 RepID=A0A367XBF5_9PROT|nr:DUF2493 domain-containing protein [Thalassospira xiamenensis]KZB56364.1 hypothetical protein AUP41_14790 [Thalassospira xiamenensis]MCK2167190.1 DUF2493 domain-containing protein [Thalassospira xiamenensis]RCK50002.1 hypothetical protein TH44_12100 [Thalassospira xiamenensis]